MTAAFPAAYEAGIGLFNAEEFWHAHEQWEQCWLAAGEPERTFYKGLIQAAAALVHRQRGNLRGLDRNWAKGRPRLVALPSPFLGLDLEAFIVAMDRCTLSRGQAPPPVIRLVFQQAGAGLHREPPDFRQR